MNNLFASVLAFVPLMLTLFVAIIVLFLSDKLLIRKAKLNEHNRPPHQLVMIILSLLAIVAVILSIPVDISVRNELLGLLGIVLTGIIAFSSTTFVANMMAGLMLRSVKSFNPGDFIEAGEHFGKVTERGLFHTEIQSEDRDLITLPNLYLSSNPVKVVRSSGTALNCSISLGYDIPHEKVEQLLKQAAEKAGLEDPFVQIQELGDFSVTYKAAGFYRNVEHLLSTRSNFKGSILDALHRAGVEIVSPSFMNQRLLDATRVFIPQGQTSKEDISAAQIFPETLIFDKANKAQKVKMIEEKRASLIEEIKALKKNDVQAEDVETQIKQLELQLRISESLLEREKSQETE